MSEQEETIDRIVATYKECVKELGDLPSYPDFLEREITRDSIRRYFGNITNLHAHMRENYSEFLDEFFSSVENVFSDEKTANRKFKKKRFVITTAVADSKAHKGFLSAISNYCDHNDAQTIIMPCESVTNSFEKKTATFDKVFNNPEYLFVNEDTKLNENLSLCSIQVSAKQIKPITGLARIGNREGSYVFASPKQFLEYIPSGNQRGKNYSIMTPGACTVSNYYSETFVSKRLSYIAEHDHTIGAIIVELDGDYFHFRQIQADPKTGEFIDLGVNYLPDGTTEDVPLNIVLGDIHGVQVDKEALSDFMTPLSSKKVDSVFLHDIFDGMSINHHIFTIYERATRSMNFMDSLMKELRETLEILFSVENNLSPENLYIVKSNHDEFLERYLKEGRYIEDEVNHYTALKIAPALFEGEDVLKRGFLLVAKTDDEIQRINSWNFLVRESTVEISNVHCSSHGDLGLNGARSSIASLEKIYGDCVVGHSHSPAIQRGVFRVGTMSNLDMEYNRGPSSWTHTNCLVYSNGQRQLLNRINSKYFI